MARQQAGGKTENAVLGALKAQRGLAMSTAELVAAVHGKGATVSQAVTVRQALRSLKRKGMVEQLRKGAGRTQSSWRLTGAGKRDDLAELAKALEAHASGEIERLRGKLGKSWWTLLGVKPKRAK